MELGLRGWNELGVVGTIYEEEDEDSSSSVPSLEFTSSPTPQLSGVEPWSLGRRHDPDVVIYVQDSCFRLHKEALIARSAYLKRQLSEFPEIILSPPLNITSQTFSLITDFCYGTHVAITPFNVAALRTAAELLGMTEISGPGDENLQQKTEVYFRRVVAVNKECASIVLRSCFSLLPEAETAASLVSRCIEALSLTAEADGYLSCLDDVKSVHIEDLQLIMESVSQRLTDSHDLLYRITDIYLQENSGTVSEDQKIRMCNYIDCSILSPGLLMHAVQNPRMPLRFVVQAMFVEQLNTRHSIFSAADHHSHHKKHEKKEDHITLGAILQRDAALRQVSQLKAIMSATNWRIQTLEKELSGMRKLLNESESTRHRIDSGRSASFRFSSERNKIERGQIGSISSLSLRNVTNKVGAEVSSPSEESSNGSLNIEKNFGQRLMSGLRSAFHLRKKKGESKGDSKLENNREKLEGEDGNEDIVVIKKDQAFHRRTGSQS